MINRNTMEGRLVFKSGHLNKYLDLSAEYHDFPIFDLLAEVDNELSTRLVSKKQVDIPFLETKYFFKILNTRLNSLLLERREEGIEKIVFDMVQRNENPPYPALKLLYEGGETYLTFLMKPDCILLVYVSIIEFLMLHLKETTSLGISVFFSKTYIRDLSLKATYYYAVSSGTCNLVP